MGHRLALILRLRVELSAVWIVGREIIQVLLLVLGYKLLQGFRQAWRHWESDLCFSDNVESQNELTSFEEALSVDILFVSTLTQGPNIVKVLRRQLALLQNVTSFRSSKTSWNFGLSLKD